MVSPNDFTLKLVDLGLEQKIIDFISDCYKQNYEQLRTFYSELNKKEFGITSLPHFQSLEWRLDVEVERRSLRSLTKPVFTLKINTTKEDLVLNADYHDLKHCCDVLERALKEVKSTHVRRIKTYIQ